MTSQNAEEKAKSAAVHFSSSSSNSESSNNMRVVVDERTAKILWRDSVFLVMGAIALLLVGFVETNAPDAVRRYLQYVACCLLSAQPSDSH